MFLQFGFPDIIAFLSMFSQNPRSLRISSLHNKSKSFLQENTLQILKYSYFDSFWSIQSASDPFPIPAGIYLLKVNNRNTRTRCEICSKLTMKTLQRRQWRRSSVFIVSFKHISHPSSSVSIVNFEHVTLGLLMFFIKFVTDMNIPTVIYFFKVNNRSTRAMCEIRSELTLKTTERTQWRRSGVFIANFEQMSHIVLVLLLLTWNK